ncbi:MAG: hypothetical protein FD131_3189 [Rhodocyclaceae bacterium]|nr:MAG: hypothetical protein FD131_3189 [Rhodocyclaceae bacterium]
MAKYFIAYAYFVPHGSQGFGNIEVDRSWPIAGTADIQELTERITDSMRRTTRQPNLTLTIISWQLFEADIGRKLYDETPPDNLVEFRPKS